MYGQIGVLAYDAIEDKVQCHICGKWFRGLSTHVLRRHGWSADDYRDEFGLNSGQSLICEGTRQKLREINKQLGNWKHLVSQTMTRDELRDFLQSVATRGFRLRPQACLLKSKHLTEYNPMNEPDVKERALAKLHKTWYGSVPMRHVCRRNIMATMEKQRQKNLEEERYTCPCGEVFPTNKEGQHHRAKCPAARQKVIQKQQERRRQWWNAVPPEQKERYRQHMRDMRKLRKIWPKRAQIAVA